MQKNFFNQLQKFSQIQKKNQLKKLQKQLKHLIEQESFFYPSSYGTFDQKLVSAGLAEDLVDIRSSPNKS